MFYRFHKLVTVLLYTRLVSYRASLNIYLHYVLLTTTGLVFDNIHMEHFVTTVCSLRNIFALPMQQETGLRAGVSKWHLSFWQQTYITFVYIGFLIIFRKLQFERYFVNIMPRVVILILHFYITYSCRLLIAAWYNLL